ncbi:hypothetical protein [Nocardia mangyaensis]|uniref:hypothetical protein n=1 Tax=Nocardia mangyaensis TaxID=2213200 RepID=UPI002675A5D5|nr:hypothetical protein [Nocardia mangyaensis]MDO3647984.1 hypothetical protein [Nocardia mangyaensis]
MRAQLAELEMIPAGTAYPKTSTRTLRDTLRHLSAKADPETADAESKATLDKERTVASPLRAVRGAVIEAGRREALAARREPGVPPYVVDRVIRRLDLGPAH